MLNAAEVEQRSSPKAAMLACSGACLTRPEWSSFSHVNVNVLLLAL